MFIPRKLIYTVIFSFFCSISLANQVKPKYPTTDIIMGADSEEQLVSYWKSVKYAKNIKRFDVQHNSFYLVYKQLSSGMPMYGVYLYTLIAEDRWKLLAFRNSNSSKIIYEFNKNSGEIVFTSFAGKTLMKIPINSVSLKVEKDEQEW